MNIAMIMSGGVGKRFGTLLPKQYTLIHGRPVIDYVIDACREAKAVDKIVVVCDPQCVQFSAELSAGDIEIAPNGSERCYSLQNGLEFIQEHYNCDNVCILDAVAPFVYPELIDEYFARLTEYDCVITCQKITGELGNYDYAILDRNDYYISQSPEAFRFSLLMRYFDPEFPSSELANQLPADTKRYLNFEFKNNLKITYDFELKYAEQMIAYFRERYRRSVKVYEKEVFITEGLQAYLLRTQPKETNEWLMHVAENYPRLAEKWEITSFIANQTSRYGLVLLAQSARFGDVIVKLIPPFVERYANEKSCYLALSNTFMCRLCDCDDAANALLLERVKPGDYARFEDNLLLTRFWDNVFAGVAPAQADQGEDYRAGLYARLQSAEKLPYCSAPIAKHLQLAAALYERCFAKETMYLIHGDLHEYNILKGANGYVAVDPIGFCAPLAFETSRFIRNDVLRNAKFGTTARLSLLFDYFGRWLPVEQVQAALYIDLSVTTYNSVYENETPRETERMLALLDTVRAGLAHNE